MKISAAVQGLSLFITEPETHPQMEGHAVDLPV
jgi:hypothetical protein